jgi:pimeloyl-ACP methyl ester carboxylesterase
MRGPNRTHVEDLRGAARMVVDAGTGITRIVERMHRTVQKTPGPIGRSVQEPTRGLTGLIYRSVRGGFRLAGAGIDASLAPASALLPEGPTAPGRDAFVAALNGVYGDYLARTRNPLALTMELRHRGRALDPDAPAAVLGNDGGAGGVLLLVHGLCMNDQRWNREGHDHGRALAGELGLTPLYLRYNSGLRISTNGRELAALLERTLGSWPQPVERLHILGHSMGGLVARSALHHARLAGHAWPRSLTKLVFLGTPHHGAPLERGGHGLDRALELSPYSAPFTRIGRQRSAGITDLRHGSITDDPGVHVPLPDDVECYAAAATLGERRDLLAERLLGDGLVPLRSALGRHADPARTLSIPESRQWIGYRMGHLELLSRAEVHAQLRSWLVS